MLITSLHFTHFLHASVTSCDTSTEDFCWKHPHLELGVSSPEESDAGFSCCLPVAASIGWQGEESILPVTPSGKVLVRTPWTASIKPLPRHSLYCGRFGITASSKPHRHAAREASPLRGCSANAIRHKTICSLDSLPGRESGSSMSPYTAFQWQEGMKWTTRTSERPIHLLAMGDVPSPLEPSFMGIPHTQHP